MPAPIFERLRQPLSQTSPRKGKREPQAPLVLDRTTPTLFVDFDGTLHVGRALIDENGQITLDSGRPLLEFAPLLVESLEPYPSVEIVLTTSWLQTLPTEDVISYLPLELARRVVDTTRDIKPRLSYLLNGSERTFVITSYAYGKRLWNWLAIDDSVHGAYQSGREPWELVKHFLLLDSTRGISDESALQRIREWLVDVHTDRTPRRRTECLERRDGRRSFPVRAVRDARAILDAGNAQEVSRWPDGCRLHFITHIAVVEDPDRYMDRIAGEERGFARALIYAETSLTQENVFGPGARVLVRDWQPPADARQFPLMRTNEWSGDVEITRLPLPDDDSVGQAAPDDLRSFFDRKLERQTHAGPRIVSPIDIPLWNEAKWRAVFYFYDPARAPLPVFCLGYAEKEAAQKIFRNWQKQFGKHDTNNEIRVVILKDILRSNPAAYRVFITGNIRPEAGADFIVSVGRHQTMTPSTTANIDTFLETAAGGSSYLLAPAHFVPGNQFPDVGLGLAIRKDDIVVRQAWEIGPNDVDSGAILADDDPVIPANVQNPPVRELLQLKGRLRTRPD